MAAKIIKVIFLLIIAGVILYVLRSGIVGSSIHSLSGSNASSSTSSKGFFNFNFNLLHLGGPSSPSNPSPRTGTGYTYVSNNTNGNTGQPTINPADVPAGFTVAQISPHFHMVRIGGASYGTFTSYGQITLYASSFDASTTLDITGWQLKARHGGEYIPQAVNYYDPSGLTPASDIQLRRGDTLYLYTNNGPFNLRLNKCIGYIAKNNRTTPSIPSYCPSVDRSQIQGFTGACQNYVLSVSSCSMPDLNDVRIPYQDYACRDYLENHFTYGSCYHDHVNDPDFLSNQIWVWTGSNVVDQYHDQLQLLDRNGLLVDLYSF